MKREFTDDHFEDFLKQQADDLRMKAPDRVWQNLSKELNGRKRRVLFGLGAFLLTMSVAGYYTITNLDTADNSSNKIIQPVNNVSTPSTSSVTVPVTTQPSAADNGKVDESTITQTINPNVNNRTSAVLLRPKAIGTFSTEESFATPSITPENSSVVAKDFTPTVVDSYTEFDTDVASIRKELAPLTQPDVLLPLSIESVVNSFRKRKSSIEHQLHFTPTISYRKLTENKSYLRSLPPSGSLASIAALYSSVNNMVTHKPDLGFEIGYTVKYPVSKRLKVRAGVQFNVNRYDIRAYSSQLSVATIALNSQNRVDSVNAVSRYSNINGYKSNWLQNFSFQVSAPIGVELVLGNNPAARFGVAGTVQPTYVLGDRAYLITTDYKSYALVPQLIRRWNVNTALETFVAFKTGKSRMQVGPQVRYQLLSSFDNKYPVKENLFDYGLKVGISLNN